MGARNGSWEVWRMHRGVWWHRLHIHRRGARQPDGLTCRQGEICVLASLNVKDRCLILIHNGWRYNGPPKTLADIIMQYIKAVGVLLRDDRWIISWHVGRSHRYYRGWIRFFRFIRRFRLALLLLLFIFLSDRLHYFSN